MKGQEVEKSRKGYFVGAAIEVFNIKGVNYGKNMKLMRYAVVIQ